MEGIPSPKNPEALCIPISPETLQVLVGIFPHLAPNGVLNEKLTGKLAGYLLKSTTEGSLINLTDIEAKISEQKKINEIRKKANAGDAKAQYNLAKHYKAIGALSEELRMYLLAANQNCAVAQARLTSLPYFYIDQGLPWGDNEVIEAYKWGCLAKDNNYFEPYHNINTDLKFLEGSFPKEIIDEAKARAEAWKKEFAQRQFDMAEAS